MNKDILNKSVSPRLIALGRWGVKGCDGWWKTQKTHFHDNDLEDESFLCLEKLQHLFIYCQTDKLLLTFSSAPLAFTITFLPLSLSALAQVHTLIYTLTTHTHITHCPIPKQSYTTAVCCCWMNIGETLRYLPQYPVSCCLCFFYYIITHYSCSKTKQWVLTCSPCCCYLWFLLRAEYKPWVHLSFWIVFNILIQHFFFYCH